MKRIGLTLIEIILVIAIIVLALSILLSVPPGGHPHDSSVCSSNLHQLSLWMRFYADDNNGAYPSTHDWCDLLAESCLQGADPYLFISPGAIDKIIHDSNQSSYVLNKNIVGMKVSDIPPDVVLLFEGPVGWNLVGGPELLTTAYHKDEGAFVSFADLSVKFVPSNQLAALKWKVDDTQE